MTCFYLQSFTRHFPKQKVERPTFLNSNNLKITIVLYTVEKAHISLYLDGCFVKIDHSIKKSPNFDCPGCG